MTSTRRSALQYDATADEMWEKKVQGRRDDAFRGSRAGALGILSRQATGATALASIDTTNKPHWGYVSFVTLY